jgi:ABC-2 type transport system permease protein
MVFLGLLTFLIAVQSYFQTTFLIYLTGIISFFIFLLIPVCLAVTLVIIISRFFAFMQAKGILVVIGLLVGSILLAAIRVMQPEQIVTVEGKMRLATFVQNLHKPWMTIFPSEWVTNILFAQIQGDLGGIFVNLLSLLILASILVALAYLLASFFYERTWADSVVMSSFAHKKFRWQIILNIFPPSLRGFIQKDLLSFYRDTIEKGSLLILIPLSFVYLYGVYLLNRHIQNAREEQIFSFLYIYLFNLFYSSVIVSGLSGRWVLPSVSSEGNNFKLIKTSPISLKDFLKAKFLLGFIPLLLLGEILILSSSFILHLQFPFTLVSVLIMSVLCWGITLLCLIFGMSEADFSIKAPLDFALSIRGFLCLTWELVFIVAAIILVGIPTTLFLYRGFSPSFIFALMVSLFVAFIILKILYHVYKSSLIELSRKEV